MNLDNTKAQMRKGVLELCILSVISNGEIYTSDLIERLDDAGLVVVQGTVYPLLSRLKKYGLLQYTWKESVAGPPRKYYELTPQGAEVLQELKGTWKELVKAVNKSTKNSTTNE